MFDKHSFDLCVRLNIEAAMGIMIIGKFSVKWVYVKDIPNQQFRHIVLENNDGKPVTNSRDTQEIPEDKGRLMLKILHSYK